MSQYRTGRVVVANGSPTVISTNGAVWSSIVAGNWFCLKGANLSLTIQSAQQTSIGGFSAWGSGTTYAFGARISYSGKIYVSLQASNLNKQPNTQTAYWTETNGWSLTLATNWALANYADYIYGVVSDFTDNFDLPLPTAGDLELSAILSRAFAKIDDELGVFLPSSGYYVDAFGAEGDGTTDDTAAFNSALAAAGAGGTVFLTPGKNYKTTSVLTVPADNMTISGTGAMMTSANDTQYKKFQFTYRTGGIVRGIKFNCLYSSASLGIGEGTIKVIASSGIKIYDCEFNDVAHSGVCIVGASPYCSVYNNKFYRNFCAIFIDDDGGSGQPTYLTLTGNNIRDGISSSAKADYSGAIKISGLSANTHNIVYGNTIKSPGQMGIEVQGPKAFLVANNTVYSAAFNISISVCSNVVVSGNVLTDASYNGLEIASGSHEIVVSGNVIRNSVGSSVYGLTIVSASYNVAITGNHICAVDRSIYVQPYSSGSVTIVGNVITGDNSIYLHDCSRVVISGNTLEGTGSNPFGAIWLDASDQDMSAIDISGNRIGPGFTNSGIFFYSPSVSNHVISEVTVIGNNTIGCNTGAGMLHVDTHNNDACLRRISVRDNYSGTNSFQACFNIPRISGLDVNMTWPNGAGGVWGGYPFLHLERGTWGYTATANKTFELPNAVVVGLGWETSVEKEDGSANTVTITGYSGQTLSGAASVVLRKKNDRATFQSDGSNWFVIQNTASVTVSGLEQPAQSLHFDGAGLASCPFTLATSLSYIFESESYNADILGMGFNYGSIRTLCLGDHLVIETYTPYQNFNVPIISGGVNHVTYVCDIGSPMKVYVNGALAATAGSNVSTEIRSNNGNLLWLGTDRDGNPSFKGKIRLVGVYNRALSEADIVLLHRDGTVASGDISLVTNDSGVAVGASNTSLVTVANSTFASDSGYWTKSSATIASNVCTLAAGGYIARSILNSPGQRRRVTVTINSIVAGNLQVNTGNSPVNITGATTAGTYTFDYICDGTAPLSLYSASGAVIDNVLFYALGAIIAPEANALGSGTTWRDVSGNAANITWSGTSVTWSLPWSGYLPTVHGLTLDSTLVFSSSGVLAQSTAATTANKYFDIRNTGGGFYFGVESSGGATMFGGGTAYSSNFGTQGATSLHFATNGTVRATIAAAGDISMTGALAVAGALTHDGGYSYSLGAGPFAGAPDSVIGLSSTTMQRYNATAIRAFTSLATTDSPTFAGLSIGSMITAGGLTLNAISNSPYTNSAWLKAAASTGIFLINSAATSWAGLKADGSFDVTGVANLQSGASLGGNLVLGNISTFSTSGVDNSLTISQAGPLNVSSRLTATSSITAGTTVADQGGTISAQRNALAPAQALAFYGTLGADFANMPAVLTDMTIAVSFNQSAAKTATIIANSLDALIAISDGSVRWYSNNVQRLSVASAITYGVTDQFTLVRGSGVATLYKNGISIGSAADAQTSTLALFKLGAASDNSQVFNGTLRLFTIENRALSATEVLALYQTGAVPAGDINTVTNDANGASLGKSIGAGQPMINGANSTAASNTGFWTLGGGDPAYISGGVFNFTNGSSTVARANFLKIGCSYALRVGSHTATVLVFEGGISPYQVITAGTTYVFTATQTQLRFFTSSGGTMDDVTLMPLGALIAPEANALGYGNTWGDASGNSASITLPASGVSWLLPYAPSGGTANFVASQRNALAPAQGLFQLGSNIGAIGTLVSALGTRDFSIPFDVDVNAPTITRTVFQIASARVAGTPNEIALYHAADDQLRFILRGASGGDDSTYYLAAFSATYGVGNRVHGVLTRTGATISLKINDATVSLSFSSNGSVPVWSAAINGTLLTVGNFCNGTPWAGFVSVKIYNYLLSAAQQTALFRTNTVAASDINTVYNDSGVAIGAGQQMVSGANSTFASDTGWWTKTGSTISGGVCHVTTGTNLKRLSLFKIGFRYTLTFDVSNWGSGGPQVDDGVSVLLSVTSNGAKSLTFTAATTDLFFSANAGTMDIDNVLLTPLGALIAPEPNALGYGNTWGDASGNNVSLTLPASGVSWVLPYSPTSGLNNYVASQRNALAPAQGIYLDGTSYAAIPGVTFGTTDFTVSALLDVNTTGSGTYVISGNVGAFTIGTISGTFFSEKSGVLAGIQTPVLNAGKHLVTYRRIGGMGYFDINGVNVVSGADVQNYSVATNLIGKRSDGFNYTGTVAKLAYFNRALSPAESLTLFQTGTVDARDINTASYTNTIASVTRNSDFSAGATDWSSINGGTITVVSSKLHSVLTAGQLVNLPVSYFGGVNFAVGKRYRLVFTVSSFTAGDSMRVSLLNSNQVVQDIVNPSGTYTIDFTSTGIGTQLAFSPIALSRTFDLDDIAIYNLGAVLAPEANALGYGTTWLDTSGNASNITLPYPGASWVLPSAQNYGRTQGTLSGTTPAITFSDNEQGLDWTLTGNSTPTASGYSAGRNVNLFITGDTSTRTFTWPAWTWIGGSPTSSTANKKMRIALECRGTTAASVFATYAEQS